MPPPAELRRRLEAKAAAEKGTTPGASRREEAGGGSKLLAVCALAVAGAYLLFGGGAGEDRGAPAPAPPRPPEVDRLLHEANVAIRRHFDSGRALSALEMAWQMAPSDDGVRSFLATVLLSRDRIDEALVHFRAVFHAGGSDASRAQFLQQYVVALHRSDSAAELEEVWPKITATPGIVWTSPLHCPDLVDESLLPSAAPFPEPSVAGGEVLERLAARRAAILEEFEAFTRKPDWDSEKNFKPNQDTDLVGGNEPKRWTEMLLFDRGRWDPTTCALLPSACKALKGLLQVEGILHGKRSGQVSLLKLEAGTKLVPHFGTVNWRYTVHLGLMVPEGVWMHAGNESREFQQGEFLVLDDSFLHSVEHLGASPRVTLFANFFPPSTRPIPYEQWLEEKAWA